MRFGEEVRARGNKVKVSGDAGWRLEDRSGSWHVTTQEISLLPRQKDLLLLKRLKDQGCFQKRNSVHE